MQITRKVAPGQKGAKKLLDQYGSKLVCVRYCYDNQVAFKEVALQRKARQAGGRWNPARRVWEMRYDRAVAFGLNDRIEEKE